VLAPLLGGAGLLAVMVAWEARAPDPLIPARFFANRTRVTSNVLSLALLAAFLGYVFLLTLYMQQVLGYSPLRTGVLYLPLGIGIGAGMGLCTALMPRPASRRCWPSASPAAPRGWLPPATSMSARPTPAGYCPG
jgi:hypothetical protein